MVLGSATWISPVAEPAVGDRLLREIVASIEALADHSDLGRMVRVWRSERPLGPRD